MGSMNEADAASFLHRLFEQDPASILAWLRDVAAHPGTAPQRFNWHGMADTATMRAHAAVAPGALLWATIAVRVYEQLANDAALNENHSFEGSAMMLRAAMIRRYGAVPEDEILDPARVVDWFSDRLPFTLSQAQSLSHDWPALPIETIRELRRIKNRLNVLEILPVGAAEEVRSDVDAWLRLRPHLP